MTHRTRTGVTRPVLRWFLVIVAFRHLASALIVTTNRALYDEVPGFVFLSDLAPLSWWVWGSAIVGILTLGAAVRPREGLGRVVVVASLTITAAWATAFALADLRFPEAGGVVAVMCTAFVAKDVLILGAHWRDERAELNKALAARGLDEV